MTIPRRTDDTRAAPPTGANQAGTSKTAGVIEQWKEQLAAGQKLELKNKPSANRQSGGNPRPLDKSLGTTRGNYETMSIRYMVMTSVVITLACIGAYFLLLRLIEISHPQRCVMSGRVDCSTIMAPNR
jgi:hypothetical protein